MSLFISLFAMVVRQVTLGNYKIWQKIEKPLFSILMKRNLFLHLMQFCNKLTESLFTYKNQVITKIIIIVSSCCIGLSFGIRMAMVAGILIPYQTVLLLFFAVNGLFRSMIHFGILLRVGRNNVWRTLINSTKNNANKFISAAQTTENPENPNDHNNNNDEQKTNQEQQNTAKWTKWGVVGTWLSFSTALYFGTATAKENGELTQRNRSLEWELNRQKEYNENMKSLYETTQKRSQEIEQRITKLEKNQDNK